MKYLERIYPWLLLAPVLLSVVIWGGLIYPYLVPKTLLFYAISFAAIATFALLVAHGHAFYWRRLANKETWIPATLLALAYVASAQGIDFYRSFWSLFARGDGLLMFTCAVASFYLMLLSADREFFERLLRAVAIVGSVVAVYGIGEWLMGGGRIGSLLGNAAFFAGYLGVAFFATLAAAQSLPRGWRRTAYTGATLQVVAIILTATRGTILALAISSIVALAYFALQPSAPKEKNGTLRAARPRLIPFFPSGASGARITLIAIVIFGVFFFAFRSELAKVPFEPVARIASISANDNDIASRLFIWRHMVTEIRKSPWLGVGAEHIDTLFNRFYNPTQISEQWFDRSHNAFLDYAAQYGIGGLLLYLALIATFFIVAARFARRGERRTALILALLALAYAVQNFFVFDTVSSFWLLLALLAASLSVSLEEVEVETLPLPAWARLASWVFALALLFLIIPASVRPALAAYDLAQAYKYQLTDVSKEVKYLSHGIALGTYGDLEYGYEAYDMYASHQAAVLNGRARADAYQASLAILTANFNRYPYDGRTALYLAHVLSLAPESISADKNLLGEALARAIEQSPKRSQPWYVLANLSISRANEYPAKSSERIAGYAAAQDILAKYIALVPTLSAPHFVLAQLLYASGKPAEAAVEAGKGKEYYQSDLEAARRAMGYYETVLDLPDVTFFLQEVIRFDPTDAAAKSDLEKIQAYEQSKK